MIFSWILLAHWMGDFAFQTSKMAMGKGKKIKWLFIHVIVYTIILTIFSLFLFPIKTAIGYILINCILHGFTDFFTSKLTIQYRDTPRIFFTILGLDQLIHSVTLYITYLHIDSLIQYWMDSF
ncbi:DUF3307 domain-containing protein [Aquimarina sp. 2201CG14-23]|uniref:DUF3307 domain-containing protein n=1 Tax=Aquimarina mycalae TaxID=3040073 RepID=UPI002477E811|nr:DUF3307 domain-containing protein [Aquimarina sp. 2201CG14-23]MDH7445628.1 DUF3307 domain-containing protein [Aquimarina sp. 2201CG14-23]